MRLADRAAAVLAWLDHDDWAPFDDVLGDTVPTAVATVLAVLVLVRVGALAIQQHECDDAILVRRLTDDADVLRRIESWD